VIFSLLPRLFFPESSSFLGATLAGAAPPFGPKKERMSGMFENKTVFRMEKQMYNVN
jgi:hypothetical protein